MMIGARFHSRALFAAALVVLIATNLLVLGGVAVNRSGTPSSRLTLTERELGLGHRVPAENSGLSLHLSWRILPRIKGEEIAGHWGPPDWFDADKLTDLGYDVAELIRLKESGKYSWDTLSKEVYIVLELEGAPYREALRRAQLNVDGAAESELEAARRRLQRERKQMSRLFAIDAGLDPTALRRRYGDRQRYLIAKGLVVPSCSSAEGKLTLSGRIRRLSVEQIHVPLDRRRVFDLLPSGYEGEADAVRGPRYQVTLAYGKRFEPWIAAGAPLDEAP
jgi:hypothetical protein